MGRTSGVNRFDWDFLQWEYSGCGLFHSNFPFIDAACRSRGRLNYLAMPYRAVSVNLDGQWCPVRSDAVAFEAARWMVAFAANGVTAVSPVASRAAMVSADTGDVLGPMDDLFWHKWCQPILSVSGGVIVPPVDGWQQSNTVWREVCYALDTVRPVYLIRKGSEYGGGE